MKIVLTEDQYKEVLNESIINLNNIPKYTFIFIILFTLVHN